MSGVYLLKTEDFELFKSEKWSDKKFNGKRLMLKERLKSISDILAKRCTELASETICEIGTEYPALWNSHKVDRLELFFIRKPEIRKQINNAMSREIPISILLDSPSQLYAHASIGFIIDENGLSAGLRIPYLAIADKENLKKLMETSSAPLFDTLGSLEHSLTCMISDDSAENAVSAGNCTPEKITEKLNELDKRGENNHRLCLEFTKKFEVQNIDEDSETINEIVNIFNKLWSMYKLLAWSPENDLIDMASIVKEQQILSEQLKQEDKLKQEERNKLEESRKIKEEQKNKEILERVISQNKNTPKKQQNKTFKKKNSQNFQKNKKHKNSNSFIQKKNNKENMVEHIEKGDTVRITAGLFGGKTALVSANPASGKVKVNVNGLEVNVPLKDVKKID